MPFPLTIARRRIADPRSLATLVVGDAEAGGGQVVPGQLPSAWVYALVRAGQLEAPLAVALAAALLRSGRPGAVAAGARLSALLQDPELHQLFVHALDGLDIGVLLTADPCSQGTSVEDALLRAWVAVAPLRDDAVRADLLDRLRRAGLHDLELSVLCSHGSPEELRQWLPAALTGEPTQWGAVARGLVRLDGAEAVVAASLQGLPVATRRTLWDAALSLQPALAGRGRLRPLAGF